MQSIIIDGTFTFQDTIRNLKFGDKIKLIKNPNNKINSDAIGAYTLQGKKIGYVPFKDTQIDIKAEYTISKIYPNVFISRKLSDISNIIKVYKYNSNIMENNIDPKLLSELKSFTKFLERSKIIVKNIGITFQDENFIDLKINDTIFYTVTKKYYEKNVFIYDELYNLSLIPKNIYLPFQIHRLEVYIMKNYKSIDKLIKSKKMQDIYKSIKDTLSEMSALPTIIQKDLCLDHINYMAYSHSLKAYCYILSYDEDGIYELQDTNNTIKYQPDTSLLFMLIVKSIIANKKTINIINTNSTNTNSTNTNSTNTNSTNTNSTNTNSTVYSYIISNDIKNIFF
jgi:hypothetical protein